MTPPDLLSPRVVLFSWLLAAAAAPGAILVAALGQAAGAVAGGCTLIGLSTPLHRQAWALVNQPNLAFAASRAATGYWLGAIVLPVVVILVATFVLPRPRGLTAELAVTQWCWALAVVALAWQPLVDGDEGQVGRFLHFAGARPWLLWVVPVLALGVGLLPALRLLATLRNVRRSAGRAAREAALFLHLGLPAVAFVALATVIRGELMVGPTAAVGAVVLLPLLVTWSHYPSMPPTRQADILPWHWLIALVAAVVVVAGVWCAGHPVAPDKVAGVTWTHPGTSNNIRPWIEPLSPAEAVLDSLPRGR